MAKAGKALVFSGVCLVFALLVASSLSEARKVAGKTYVNTPIGRLPPRCVHKVVSGSEIEETDNGVLIIKHPRLVAVPFTQPNP